MILASTALVQVVETPPTNHIFRPGTAIRRRTLRWGGVAAIAPVQRSWLLPPGLS